MKADFLATHEIYCCRDEMGEIIVIQCSDDGQSINKRVLQFSSSLVDTPLEQSSIFIDKPYYLIHEYTQIMMLGFIAYRPQHVTLLGLGGGSLVHCLAHYFPHTKLQVVELRQAVIDIAYEYFALPRLSNINVSCEDAFVYLENSQQKTDLILSDLYEAEGVSDSQLQEAFILNAYNLLNDEGQLILNFHILPKKESSVMKAIENLFLEVLICDIFKGNWIVFCFKGVHQLDKKQQLSRVKALAVKMELPLMYYFKQLK